MPFLIWWTTQGDAEAIGSDLPEGVPEYMRSEWRSRLGRAGRGRLWVHPSLELPASFGFELRHVDNAICRWASGAAGLVLRAEDESHLRQLPGLVTTLGYERSGR